MAQPSQAAAAAAANPSHENEEEVVPVPQIGDRAPTLGKTIQFPHEKPVVVVFLRHCGCPCKSCHLSLFWYLMNLDGCRAWLSELSWLSATSTQSWVKVANV